MTNWWQILKQIIFPEKIIILMRLNIRQYQ